MKFKNIKENPYLAESNRLADVLAAIQTMGTYKFYKQDYQGWSKRISGDEANHEHWKTVIHEHPEFFRLNTGKDRASLVWRRNYQRLFHVDHNRELSRQECDELSSEERKERVSRLPLTSSDISVLIGTAIDLHNRALEEKRESRWWIVPLVGLLGVVIGAGINKLL